MNRLAHASGRPTLLVLRALGLGDFLTGVPAYRALARAFPDHYRVLAAPIALHPFLPLLQGAFDSAIDAPPLAPLVGLRAGLDVGVNLHGSGPQSHRVLLAAQPRRFIAFAHPAIPESGAGALWDGAEHEVPRWCRLLEAAGVAARRDELGLAMPAITVPAARRNAVLIHAGAASPARRWPLERWADVARACARRGDRVLLTGSVLERPAALELAERADLPVVNVLAGETSILGLAALVARARRVLCGDTGIAHLASAYGVASIVLFGPTPPATWGPPARARHRVLWTGRTGNPNAGSPDRGLLEISSGDVIAELDALAAGDD